MNLKMIVMYPIGDGVYKEYRGLFKKNHGKITLSELNQLESKMNDSSKHKNRKAKTLKY